MSSPTPISRGASNATPTAPQNPPSKEQMARFQSLKERQAELKNQRLRLEVALERAERDEQECRKEAEAFGVSSLEELQALIKRAELEDQEKLNTFERDLKQEEELLNQIKNTLDVTSVA